MSILKKTLLYLDEKLESHLCAFIVLLMFILVFYQVVLRYVFNSPNNWTEELARYCHVYLIFISCSYAAKKKMHVRVDVLLNIWPKKIRYIAALSGELLWLVFAVAIWVLGIRLTRTTFAVGQISVALRFPLAFVYMALPIGYSLLIIRLFQIQFSKIREYLTERRSNI